MNIQQIFSFTLSKTKNIITKYKDNNVILWLSICLLALSLVYLSKGFYNLVIDPKEADDLFLRWQEQQYIYRGLYPYDVKAGSSYVDPDIGAVTSGGYPPWSFFTGFLFFPNISWELTRWYHVFLNIIALTVVAYFSYRIGAKYSRERGIFSMASVLAISSHATTLNVGQYGIIINALSIAGMFCLEYRRNVFAGLLLAMAMAKPNISIFYFFPLLIKRRIQGIIAFCLYMIFALVNIWIITKINPVYMLDRIWQQYQHFAKQGTSSLNILLEFGVSNNLAIILIAILGFTVISAAIYWCRDRSLLTLFAAGAVIARLIFYHRIYDNLMLFFLLLAVLEKMFDRPNKKAITVFTLVGLSLWIPAKIVDLPYISSLQFSIWIVALIYLIFSPNLPSFYPKQKNGISEEFGQQAIGNKQ
jgi:hypothetical protein